MGGKRKTSLVVTEKDQEIVKKQSTVEESKSLKKPKRITSLDKNSNTKTSDKANKKVPESSNLAKRGF